MQIIRLLPGNILLDQTRSGIDLLTCLADLDDKVGTDYTDHELDHDLSPLYFLPGGNPNHGTTQKSFEHHLRFRLAVGTPS